MRTVVRIRNNLLRMRTTLHICNTSVTYSYAWHMRIHSALLHALRLRELLDFDHGNVSIRRCGKTLTSECASVSNKYLSNTLAFREICLLSLDIFTQISIWWIEYNTVVIFRSRSHVSLLTANPSLESIYPHRILTQCCKTVSVLYYTI